MGDDDGRNGVAAMTDAHDNVPMAADDADGPMRTTMTGDERRR